MPGAGDTAIFGPSTGTAISVESGFVTDFVPVGAWLFIAGAPQYTFTVGFVNQTVLQFMGAGITVAGGSAAISIGPRGEVDFYNGSSAGSASFDVSPLDSIVHTAGAMVFNDTSTAGTANITNDGSVSFKGSSSAGFATIHTGGSLAELIFADRSDGGNAQINTDAGGITDFSQSAGPHGDHKLSVGSIEGAGTYLLGGNQLTVGSNDLSKTLSGVIYDGGLSGSLVKVGLGRFTLANVANTYSGGTTIKQGSLELAAIGTAGTRAIKFAGTSKATLAVDNAALSGHVFATNPIDFFGKHDVVDLTGLPFHHHATAIYHKGSHHLTVHSGTVTDTLTLLSPHGTHFKAANDHHGGTDVFLVLA
jgi:autotransporter-associated beta strand protein